MRIASITHSYPNEFHPTESSFIRELNGQLQKDHQVEVWVPTVRSLPLTQRWKRNHAAFLSSVPDEHIRRLRYLSIPRRKAPGWVQHRLAGAIIKKLRSDPPDVIHMHWAYPEAMSIARVKEALNLPVVATVHGGDWYQIADQSDIRGRVLNGLESADRIVAVGERLAKDLQVHLDQQVKVIPNGVDLEQFYPVEKSKKRQLRERLGWDPADKHFIHVAHFRHEKGQLDLVEAIRQSSELQQIQFHLLGYPFEPDYHRQVMDSIRQYGLENITWHGNVPRGKIAAYYQASDAFVLPSHYEGFGVALIEAQACGLPAVVTDTGGPKEIINRTKAGILVPPKNRPKLITALEDLVDRYDRFDIQGLYESIKSAYAFDKVAHRYHSLFQEVANS
jgi:teichuronic acid biosynthesis glycosyltransferase TuaC